MKILRLYQLHRFYIDIDRFFENHCHLPYEEVIEILCMQGAISPKLFKTSMESLGCEATDVVVINTLFEKKWCQEHGYDHQDSYSTIDAMISHYKPDVLFLERDTFCLDTDFKLGLKKKHPYLKCIAARWGAQTPAELLPLFKGIDIIFVIDQTLKDLLKTVVPKVHICRPAFDHEPTSPIPIEKKKYLYTFAGITGHQIDDHTTRFSMLKKMLAQTPLIVFGSEPLALSHSIFYGKRFQKLIKRVSRYVPSKLLDKVGTNGALELKQLIADLSSGDMEKYSSRPLKFHYKKRVMPPRFGEAYTDILRNSVISFNCHIDDLSYSGNFRCFEVTGAGSCLLTDRGEKMQNEFVLDEEIVSYSSFEEALEKFTYLQKNPAIADHIALKGMERTMKEHTTFNRSEYVYAKILNTIK